MLILKCIYTECRNMIMMNYESPTIEVVGVECDDVITTSILLPPYEFGSTSGAKSGEYDVF